MVEFVKTPEEADMILLWITPGSKSLFEADGSPLYLSLSKNGVDINYINGLTAKKTYHTCGQLYQSLGDR